jgi:hypothetical protein
MVKKKVASSSGGGKFRLSVPRGESGQQQQERALRAVFTAQPSNDTMQLRVESLELQVWFVQIAPL